MILRKIKILIIFLTLFYAGQNAWASEKLDLKQCYDLALRRSEVVAISNEEIVQARARFTQALGIILPRLSVRGSEILQDDSGNDATGAPSSVTSTFTRFSRPEVAITATQSLFRGLQELNAFKLARADEARSRYLKVDVERLLFRDVATVFYSIAGIEQGIRTTQRMIGILRNGITEIRGRVNLGKSRPSEQLAQEASLSLLEADLERRRGDLKIAYDMLSFLTGLAPQPEILVKDPLKDPLKPIEQYLVQAPERPDVKAAGKAIEMSKSGVKIHQGDLFPKADVTANYYPYRVGFQKEIQWDANFQLNIPVFNYTTHGEIREAKSKVKQAELQESAILRIAKDDIKKSYESYQSTLRQFKKYQWAALKAEESFQKQQEDYRSSLITNLEVLQSERTWLEALRFRDEVQVQAWMNWTNLQMNTGVWP